MYADDNDQYSEDEHSRDNKAKIKPLNLTEKELKDRLLTLKNYNIWKKTKAKRINCKELVGDQSSPIIHTAASYGSRYGQNEVFIQFIQQSQSPNPNHSQSKKQFDVQAAMRESRKEPKQKPSFLNYKADEKQKQKIYRMINRNPKLSAGQLSIRKRRSSTQPRLNKQSQRAAPYPRELAKLKDKLRILPSLINKNKAITEVEVNPQQQNATLSLGSKQQSQAINIAVPFKYSSKLSNPNNSFMYSDNSRSSYLKNIHSILSKSSELLNGTVEADLIRVSNSSYNSEKRSQSEYFRPNSKPKYLAYWPNYSKYGVSQSDQVKLQRILKKCRQINTEAIVQNQDIKEMTSIIKEQIGSQQREIDEEVLEEEKNAFEHKFEYKINLEQEKYKRNMKELIRCKKEYRMEKQREEIRANGIKRMKKFRQIDTRKFKVTQDQQEHDQD